MADSKKMISFVIPCYNSELTIADVVDEIEKEFYRNDRYEYEIILVNDASPKDDTLGKIKQLAIENKRVRAVDLSKNFGQDSALMAGYSLARGQYIISLDDDGQNPASEAWKLLDKIEEGWDVVFGQYHVKKHSKFKNFGSCVNGLMATALLGKPKDLKLCSYFVMDRFVVDQMLKDKNATPYIWGLMLRSTNKLTNVYIDHRAREVGESNFTIRKCLQVWLNGFISFSVKPLRLSAIVGTLTAIIGFIVGLVLVGKRLICGEPVEGWTSLIVVQLLLGGIIMIMLGLLGEYVGRMNISVNNTPPYIIRDIYEDEQDKEK